MDKKLILQLINWVLFGENVFSHKKHVEKWSKKLLLIGDILNKCLVYILGKKLLFKKTY